MNDDQIKFSKLLAAQEVERLRKAFRDLVDDNENLKKEIEDLKMEIREMASRNCD